MTYQNVSFKFKRQEWNTDQLVWNILEWYQIAETILTDEQFQDAIEWYDDAHNYAQTLHTVFEGHFTMKQIVAIISALSPANNWEQNKRDAATLLTAAYEGHENPPTTSTYPLQTDKAWSIALRHTHIETYNDGTQREYTPSELDKLGTIGRKDSHKSAMKTKAFYRCILNPTQDKLVCVDRHALSIGMDKLDATDNLSCSPKVYGHFSDAYIQASKSTNLTPAQLQAVTWVAYKQLTGR
jgi:hypothetical protein